MSGKWFLVLGGCGVPLRRRFRPRHSCQRHPLSARHARLNVELDHRRHHHRDVHKLLYHGLQQSEPRSNLSAAPRTQTSSDGRTPPSRIALALCCTTLSMVTLTRMHQHHVSMVRGAAADCARDVRGPLHGTLRMRTPPFRALLCLHLHPVASQAITQTAASSLQR
jgi:hypothetical protein